jgi:hypothetical protein
VDADDLDGVTACFAETATATYGRRWVIQRRTHKLL